MRRPRSLRTRLLLSVLVAATALIAALSLGFNLILDARLKADANDLLRQRAVAHLATLTLSDGRLKANEAPDDAAPDAPIWVYDTARAVELPLTSRANLAAAGALAGGPRRFREVPATETRLFAVPVVHRGRRVGTVIAGVALAPYRRTAQTALVASLFFAVLSLLAIALAARWAIKAALRPVAQMTSEAAERSEHNLDARFSLGPPNDELTRLAATFDGLLGRIAASLRREQSFSAEISHELRTPLAKLIAETELALRRERQPEAYREALRAVRADAGQMQRTLETLLSAARAAGERHGVGDARQAAARAVDACSAAATARGIEMRLVQPAELVRVGTDEAVLERILAPILENGCRFAGRIVSLDIHQADGVVQLTVSDDGPGVDPHLQAHVFEPGVRGSERDTDGHPGAGLGLSLARRLARAVDGDVEYLASGTGATFEICLPSA